MKNDRLMSGNAPVLGILVGLLVVSPLWLAANAEEQDREQRARAALERFLNTSCAVGEQRSPLDDVLKYEDLLEPVVLDLLRKGPDREMLDQARMIDEERWLRRAAFLDTQPDLGLTPQELLPATSLSRGEFMERERERFVLSRRERAITALSAIGSPTAVEALREAEEQESDELREFIRATLEIRRPIRREPSDRKPTPREIRENRLRPTSRARPERGAE